MERFHWVQHRCRQLLEGDLERGSYSAPDGLSNEGSLDAHSPSRKISGKRRTVYARHGPHQQEYEGVSKSYKGNAIQTTKYSILTFIPMNLFLQFHRSDCWSKSYTRNEWKYVFFWLHWEMDPWKHFHCNCASSIWTWNHHPFFPPVLVDHQLMNPFHDSIFLLRDIWV